jgi:glycosyltransferase involved in cell wall biosynthesis
MESVTVVVPTRNRPAFLAQTLKSIVRQRGVDLRVLVIDDGSTDDMGPVCAAFSDSRISMLRVEKPRGVSVSRNEGLERSATEWVAFCDDDDLWSPEKLERQVTAARNAGSDWAYAGCVHVNLELRVQNGIPPLPPQEMCRALLRYNAMPAGASNVLARPGVLKQLGAFDPSLTHVPDWDLWLRLAAHGAPAAVAAPLVAYRIHGGNASFRTDEMLEELGILERRHGLHADRSRFHRHLAHLCFRRGRRREALWHFWRAYARVQDGYRAVDVTTDLRQVGEQLAAMLRRRLPLMPPPRSPLRSIDPHAAWKAEAQAWIDELVL